MFKRIEFMERLPIYVNFDLVRGIFIEKIDEGYKVVFCFPPVSRHDTIEVYPFDSLAEADNFVKNCTENN